MDETLTATQKRVLKEFLEEQCQEPWNEHQPQRWTLRDEFTLFTYKRLERETGFNRTQLRRAVLDMKRRGIIELSVAVNSDYVPSGSGYMLTTKGLALINDLFPYENPELNPSSASQSSPSTPQSEPAIRP